MELILLSLGLGVVVVFWIGVTAWVTMVATLAYGRFYYDKAECDGTARYYWPAARSTFVGALLRRLLRHELVEAPSSLPPGPVLFACRPHGIFVVSAWLTFLLGAYERPPRPRVLLAIHSVIFAIPGLREFALMLGCIDVSRASIEAALARGYSVAVLPGGVKEMGPSVVPLPDEPGIVKLAQDYDVPLVPVWFGGEVALFWVWHGEPRWVAAARALCITRWRIPFPLFWCPRFWRVPRLRTIMGDPVAAGGANGNTPLHVSLKENEAALRQRE